MPAPVVYKSSDTSAPTLSGTTGSLVALLDACLVNGYGSKSAAGWTKAFSATNKGSYLGSAGHYLDVDDSGAGSGVAKEANVRGYEAMTAVATGTGPFPTTSQAASPGLYVRKSATADATSRGWVLIADGTTFHFFALTGDGPGFYAGFSFGRFYSFKTGDTYRSCIFAHTATGSATSTGPEITALQTSITGTTSGLYAPRIAAGTGTSTNQGLLGFSTSVLSSPGTGPNPTDGNVYISRLFVADGGSGDGGLRGYLRGIYQIITASALNDGDTFTGAGDFAGRTFTVLKRSLSGAYFALETSAWDSSS